MQKGTRGCPYLLGCQRMSAERDRSSPVDDQVQAQPDHIHKVPVPGCPLKAEMALSGEVPLLQAQGDDQEHQHPDEHVQAVEACEHEES